MPGEFGLQEARKFADRYVDATSEKQLGQSFWRDLFINVVGIPDLMSVGIEFEFPVRSSQGTINFIDVLWKGVVLVEHKSARKSLDVAEKQAREYLVALPAAQRPPTIIVSDFKRLRIIEVLVGTTHEFRLEDLPQNLDRLELVVGGHAEAAAKEEITADLEAVKLMANLFIEFEKAGYEGHEVSVFLVRILFLNFGDDTRMWKRVPRGLFGTFLDATVPDGLGVGGRLQELFQVLDTPVSKRPGTLAPALADFPYVNGGLFKEILPVFSFTAKMHEALILTSQYDWSKISPAIFGAMFQKVKSKEDRRFLGEHFTSEANILKVIRPLFLDDFNDKLYAAWESIPGLKKLKFELAQMHYLDPACGSGNFLVVAYKRLREIELKLTARLQGLEGNVGELYLDGRMGLGVTLDQFHGFEINEWSSQIATVAMYLADHQANLEMEEVTGSSPNRFPLQRSAHIHHVNSLQVSWADLVPMGESTYIMGNPPFKGSLLMSNEQKNDTRQIWNHHKKSGLVDLVTNWFVIASRLVFKYNCRAAFISTNSITQGEQPELLWGELNKSEVSISFANRPFDWSNDASGEAAAHVVIVGLAKGKSSGKKPLWTYETYNSNPTLTFASNINPYLIDASDVIIGTRQQAISPELPPMFFGSMPRDNGHLSKISLDEAEEIRSKDPIAAKYLRRLIGADELIKGKQRYCLWLEDAEPQDLRNSPELSSRIKAVSEMRLASDASSTREAAKISHLFVQRAQPKTPYIAVPGVSSEARSYVPIDYFPPEVIASNALLTVPNASLAVFAVLMSKPFNVWNSVVSGRLESRYRISQEITFNNFPLRGLSDEERQLFTKTGQGILDARAKYPNATLADLYGSTSMPIELLKAHQANDKAVLKVFGLKADAPSEAILVSLFKSYDEMTRGLLEATPVKVKRKKSD